LCLAGAIACSGAILLILQSHLTFFADDWDFLLQRRGLSLGVFLDRHNGHIVLAPVSIYKLLLAIFGMRSALPFQVVSTLVFLLGNALLFVYLRRRVGDWPALLGTALILFLGASWVDLLWSYQIGFSGSITAGLGAMLALDRDDRMGDRIACALLVVSLSFSESGVPFVAAALVNVLVSRRRLLPRLYLALVPIALYAVWWLGHGGTRAISRHNVLASPKFVFDAVSQAIASLLGLATPLSGSGRHLVGLGWGRILLVTAIGLSIWRFRRVGRVPRALWVPLAAGGSFWLLAAFVAIPDQRTPITNRYQYPGAVFVLLIAAEVLRGVRPRKAVIAGMATITVAAVLSGLWLLHLGYSENRKPMSDRLRAELAAVEIARTVEARHLRLSGLRGIHAGAYLSAVDAFGSPADSEPELASSPAPARFAADQLLASALRIRLRPASPASSTGGGAGSGCRTVVASPTGETGLEPVPGTVVMRARRRTSAEVLLARFSDGFSVDLGALQPGSARSLTIPADRSTRPWRLGLRGAGPVTVCERGDA
jgi:hypothetical protein